MHHGRIVKRTGDGSIIEFRSVVDAVRCAIEVQNGMVERNAGRAARASASSFASAFISATWSRRATAISWATASISPRGSRAIAEPGAICLSEDAYRQVSGRLDLAVTDLGPTQLKNIAEPIRVYSLQVGVPAQAKPATAAEPAAPKKRSSLAPLAAGIAALLIVARGRGMVAPRSEPARGRRNEVAGAGRFERDDAS